MRRFFKAEAIDCEGDFKGCLEFQGTEIGRGGDTKGGGNDVKQGGKVGKWRVAQKTEKSPVGLDCRVHETRLAR